jgi:imidazolonepropionase-like amidohydrolase
MARVFGWTAERALQAATSRASRALGLQGDLGRIAEGQLADFVVMRGRPWQDLADLDTANIVAVVSKGVVVSGELPR